MVLPILAAPFYVIATALNLPTINFVFLLLNSVIIAGSAVVMFYLGKQIYGSEKIGFALSLIFGLSSYLWPYITSMYARPLGILFFMICLYLILHQKNRTEIYPCFLAGITIGLSFLSHPHFLILLPPILIFGLYKFRKNKKQILVFLIAIIICFLILGSLNYVVKGSFFQLVDFPNDPYKDKALKNPFIIFEGIYGYLFSPGLSIFFLFSNNIIISIWNILSL